MKSVCYNNTDCPSGQVCDIEQGKSHGACQDMCRDDEDCPDEYLCNMATNLCKEVECRTDDDCNESFRCEDGYCISVEPLNCPEGMVSVGHKFCIDAYEASRPDATVDSAGSDSSFATSRPGVFPWQVMDNNQADQACRAAGKSLCTEDQWYLACIGPSGTIYSYGDDYDPVICNSIDTFCNCESSGPCGDQDPCPYPHCYNDCDAWPAVLPTGHFSNCKNGFGVFDMNGNFWEHVLGGDGTRIRGGAFNCLDSETLHRCDYIPGDWEPSAQSFRCCSTGLTENDAGEGDTPDSGGGE
ncbi:MAG: SUMF1/EgtB/PvdO family nonheme iron enzyme [Proteobacteria bacterium]|nr:SUMF1/EgtB/PvdO family nonheme iron enzyme [Pseudomonadota bacterium]